MRSNGNPRGYNLFLIYIHFESHLFFKKKNKKKIKRNNTKEYKKAETEKYVEDY